MLDGLEVAGQTVVVTLGITIDGTKVPLGIWLGSTENSRVCTAMLQDLLERGLRVDESILCVVDGGKGIRKALVDVLGDLAVIQRSSGQNTRTPSGSAVCTSTIITRGIIQARRICCCSQPATSYLSPSTRCAPVNGLAGCYVSTIGKPQEYFDLTR